MSSLTLSIYLNYYMCSGRELCKEVRITSINYYVKASGLFWDDSLIHHQFFLYFFVQTSPTICFISGPVSFKSPSNGLWMIIYFITITNALNKCSLK